MIKTGKPKFFYGYIVVAAAFLIMVVMWGSFFSFGVFLEPLLAEFGWTRALTSGTFSLSLLLFGFLGLISGRLTDKFNPRIVLTVCGFLFGLGYLLMSQVNAIWQLYLLYGVMVGVGMSGSVVPLTATVARWFAKRRGAVTGITVAGIGIGVLIMPPLVNWLISGYGWRSAYFVVGLIALVLTVLAAQFLKRDPRQIGQLAYGETRSEENGLDLQVSGFSFQGAIRTGQFWTLGAIFFCFGFFWQTISAHVVSHGIRLGISATYATSVLAVIGGISVAGRIVMGGIGDRTGSKLALVIAFALMSVALFWLQLAGELWMLYLFAVVFSFGYGGESTLRPLMVAELFGLREHGVIHGAVLIGSTTGGAIGPLVAGYIFDVTGSYQLAFLIGAIISVIGLILILSIKPARREEGANESGRSF